jgi:site-specific DNA-methyltransferase (adenine-specific)
MLSKVLFSHKTDEYITPSWLIDELKKEFDFSLDACTTGDNPTAMPDFYTIKENGLNKDWETWTYCNPPYSEIAKWAQKTHEENFIRGIGIVMLLPARTDTRWFHQFIYNKPNVEIRFLKGRLKFEGTKYPAPFPNMLVIFASHA